MLKQNRIYKFYEQVKQETYRVTWPSKKELITSTIVILITVSILSVIYLGLDYFIHSLINKIINIGN